MPEVLDSTAALVALDSLAALDSTAALAALVALDSMVALVPVLDSTAAGEQASTAADIALNSTAASRQRAIGFASLVVNDLKTAGQPGGFEAYMLSLFIPNGLCQLPKDKRSGSVHFFLSHIRLNDFHRFLEAHRMDNFPLPQKVSGYPGDPHHPYSQSAIDR